jgi:hypothetical protein
MLHSKKTRFVQTMNDLTATFAALATEECQSEEERSRVLREIEAPDWYLINSFPSGWGYLIPAEIEKRWATLPPEIKIGLYLVAKAGSEHIDGYASHGLDL